MIISKEDMEILRKLEKGNQEFYLASDRLVVLERFWAGGVLKDIIPVPFLPKFLGGEWKLACAVGRTNSPLRVKEELIKVLPYIYEMLYNWTIPSSIGHNLSFFFYTRNLKEDEARLKGIPYFFCSSLYSVADYSFPLRASLSSLEEEILGDFLKSPALLSYLGEVLKDEERRTKLSTILRDENNPSGFLSLLPEIDWSRIENFIHCHFLLTVGKSLEIIERDLWNFQELAENYDGLLKRGEAQGIIIYKKNEPLNYWAKEIF